MKALSRNIEKSIIERCSRALIDLLGKPLSEKDIANWMIKMNISEKKHKITKHFSTNSTPNQASSHRIE